MARAIVVSSKARRCATFDSLHTNLTSYSVSVRRQFAFDGEVVLHGVGGFVLVVDAAVSTDWVVTTPVHRIISPEFPTSVRLCVLDSIPDSKKTRFLCPSFPRSFVKYYSRTSECFSLNGVRRWKLAVLEILGEHCTVDRTEDLELM